MLANIILLLMESLARVVLSAVNHHTSISDVLRFIQCDSPFCLSHIENANEKYARDNECCQDNKKRQVDAQASRVARLLTGLEQKRSNNISDTGAYEEHCGSDLSFCVAACVLSRPGVDERRDARIHGDEVVADEQDSAIAGCAANDEKNNAAGDGREAEKKQNYGFHADKVGEPGAAESGNHLNSAKRHVKQNSCKFLEAE